MKTVADTLAPMMRHGLRTFRNAAVLIASVALALSGCGSGSSFGASDAEKAAPGGDGTVRITGVGAFSQPAANLDDVGAVVFRIGDEFFTEPWTSAPGPEPTRDGLGPTYLSASCAACHVADGRGSAPSSSTSESFPILRFVDDNGKDVTADAYGIQVQTQAIDGVLSEAIVEVRWEEVSGAYVDGTPYTLRRPVVTVRDEMFGSIGSLHARSVRVAPPLIGVGLLEAISASAILENADPEDLDGNGISGVASRAVPIGGGESVLGRFGLKSNVASIADQTAFAYLFDMGITSPSLPSQNCPTIQVACAEARSGGSPEISGDRLDAVIFYSQTLAVPARKGVSDASVVEGEEIFDTLGCSACHIARWTTGEHSVLALSEQTILPYTDMLLHDMGGGLSDGRSDGTALPSEWRTSPLWGLGMIRSVNPDAGFLHDGRARTIEEAVLWHGGEAAVARNGFVALDVADRERLLIFLKSL